MRVPAATDSSGWWLGRPGFVGLYPGCGLFLRAVAGDDGGVPIVDDLFGKEFPDTRRRAVDPRAEFFPGDAREEAPEGVLAAHGADAEEFRHRGVFAKARDMREAPSVADVEEEERDDDVAHGRRVAARAHDGAGAHEIVHEPEPLEERRERGEPAVGCHRGVRGLEGDAAAEGFEDEIRFTLRVKRNGRLFLAQAHRRQGLAGFQASLNCGM